MILRPFRERRTVLAISAERGYICEKGGRMNVISPTQPKARISVEEMERRREALRRADAHNRIEGLFPRPETTAVYDLFIRGEIELDQIRPRIEALQSRP
jgi:hypothetical protein